MMDSDILLARIDERQKAMDERVESHQLSMVSKLDAILKEVQKTNGRVNVIETERLPKLEHWKSRITGIWFTIGIVATVFAFILGWVIEFGK